MEIRKSITEIRKSIAELYRSSKGNRRTNKTNERKERRKLPRYQTRGQMRELKNLKWKLLNR